MAVSAILYFEISMLLLGRLADSHLDVKHIHAMEIVVDTNSRIAVKAILYLEISQTFQPSSPKLLGKLGLN